jgi:EAL and modified HD-GYP domain-containing signal transduction protein
LDGFSAGMALPAGIDFRFILADAAASIAGAPGLLLAKGLADNAQFDTCIHKGFGGAAGWFFLKGVTPAKKLNPNQAQTIRLLNLVRANADIKEIEAALKQDVALSVKLLRYINSAGFGLTVEIQSFRHAVTMLGYDKLNKWLSLLLVTSSKDAAAPALMQAAIARGRFMELTAAGYVDKNELDNLFITGAFSLLDILLGVLMETALADMHLPDTINDALISGSGPYASFLALAQASEQADYTRYAALAAELQLDPATVNHAQLEALSFADSLQLN